MFHILQLELVWSDEADDPSDLTSLANSSKRISGNLVWILTISHMYIDWQR